VLHYFDNYVFHDGCFSLTLFHVTPHVQFLAANASEHVLNPAIDRARGNKSLEVARSSSDQYRGYQLSLLGLANFENAQKEILYGYRINISRDRNGRTTPIRPASKIDEWRIQFFDALHYTTLSLYLLLTSSTQTFGKIKIVCV